MKPYLRGLLIGPAIAPIAYWIGVTAHASTHGYSFSGARALRELLVIVAFGLPIAYATAFVWGAPMLWALRRLGWLRAPVVIAAGTAGGTVVAALFALGLQGSMIRVRIPLAVGAVLGALVAAVCWWSGPGSARRRGVEETDGE